MSTVVAAAAESLAARTRVLLLWAAAAVAQAMADLKAPDMAGLVDLGVQVAQVAQVARVVLHRDLEAGKESQRALLE